MTKWIIGLGLYAAGMAWLLWEIRHAPEAKDCLPHSRKCSWCGKHMSDTDKWLEDNGALVTHGTCPDCESNLMGRNVMSEGTQLELGKRHEIEAPAGVSELLKLAQNGVSVDALERLVALVERTTERNARMAYFEALSAFQSEVGVIRKNKEVDFPSKSGGRVKYSYAELPEIERHIRPLLVRHGLSYTWDQVVAGDMMTTTCRAMHIDGHSEQASFTCKIEAQAKMSIAQSTASTGSYGRRQSLTAVLGISTADTDTDGRAPDFGGPTITASQAADLDALVQEVLPDEGRRLRFYKWLSESTGASTLLEVPASRYGDVVSALESKR